MRTLKDVKPGDHLLVQDRYGRSEPRDAVVRTVGRTLIHIHMGWPRAFYRANGEEHNGGGHAYTLDGWAEAQERADLRTRWTSVARYSNWQSKIDISAFRLMVETLEAQEEAAGA